MSNCLAPSTGRRGWTFAEGNVLAPPSHSSFGTLRNTGRGQQDGMGKRGVGGVWGPRRKRGSRTPRSAVFPSYKKGKSRLPSWTTPPMCTNPWGEKTSDRDNLSAGGIKESKNEMFKLYKRKKTCIWIKTKSFSGGFVIVRSGANGKYLVIKEMSC